MKAMMLMCATAILICGMGLAQSNVERLSVHFATPVVVGDSRIPAGDCTIQVIRGSSDSVLLELRGASDRGSGILVPVSRMNDSAIEGNGHARIVLSLRNDQYQLDQLILGDGSGFQIPE
ncbi:MAG TPA: hypothetical protein VMH81_32900 [Bryobacteraceae bacterium]|nr:hypothetical protein [Bryobacteraceae bacterium]